MVRAAAVALAVVSLACRHAASAPGADPAAAPPLKLAFFPVQNASGGTAPIRALSTALEAALNARGLTLVRHDDLDVVLATHRIRFTGGVDRAMAKVLREELGVAAVIVPTLETYGADAPPRLAIGFRVIGTGDTPMVLWADSVARAGDDAPGLLGIGRITVPAQLEQKVVTAVADSIVRWINRKEPGASCGGAGRFEPARTFRAPVLDDVGRRTIAVLPFTNETKRRGAADVVAGQFVGQLARSGSFEVIDPGAVREQLLANHVVLDGGVSIDQAMAVLSLLDADLVLSGYVQVYEARSGIGGEPKVEFTAFVLDRRMSEQVWSTSSHGAGDQGVFFFGAGRVYTAPALSCRMIRGAVDGLVGRRPPLASSD